ncbi:MAG: hypothetical protein AAF556_09595 [Pseudomonadota bacterium]
MSIHDRLHALTMLMGLVVVAAAFGTCICVAGSFTMVKHSAMLGQRPTSQRAELEAAAKSVAMAQQLVKGEVLLLTDCQTTVDAINGVGKAGRRRIRHGYWQDYGVDLNRVTAVKFRGRHNCSHRHEQAHRWCHTEARNLVRKARAHLS